MWQYTPYNELYHHGILGQKWGIRRFQNSDGTLTAAGRERMVKQKHSIETKKGKRAIAAATAGVAVNQAAKQISKSINKKALEDATLKKAMKIVPLTVKDGIVSNKASNITGITTKMAIGTKVVVKDFVSNPLVQSTASIGVRYLAKSGLMSIGMAAIPASLVVTGSMIAATLISDVLKNDIKLRRDLNEERQTQEKYNIKNKE